ncbi:MAG: hypothetical protein JSW62_05270 [Thermoplasmatales archaeon]|nr:MAG: hypothetical protein JSW62_05270 [Thermoplasmatales archaeon]
MNRYTKEQTYRITRKIYKTLREYPSDIIWDKMHGRWGLYDPETQDMSINYKGALVPTIIHECIHHWYPDLCETKVLEEERKIVNSISPTQAMNLMNLFLDLFKKNDD